ncbi:MAG: hypothetical protein ACLT2F_08625 [Butyricicoccus sp.]
MLGVYGGVSLGTSVMASRPTTVAATLSTVAVNARCRRSDTRLNR